MLDWFAFLVANDVYDLQEEIEDIAYVLGGIVEIMKEDAQDNNLYNLNGY